MTPTAEITFQPSPKPVHDLVSWFKGKQLNLSPGFQRDSVWTQKDQMLLIDSIIRNYPLPAIFLYQRLQDGEVVYDVIDGKQRLEAIFKFMGVLKGKFSVKTQLPGEADPEELSWDSLKRKNLQHLISTYRLSIIEVNGDLSDIINLFVRINSTGKALTSAEKQHARYYRSAFLKVAARTAERYTPYFLEQKIISQAQVSRMKHIELTCELMASFIQGDVIDKRVVLDKVMGKSMPTREIEKARSAFISTVNRVKQVFPTLANTRFRSLSDFYVLAFLVFKFDLEKRAVYDATRKRLAYDLLVAFSNGVDRVRENQKKAQGITPGDELYREYLLTTIAQSNDLSHRRKRLAILDGLLGTLFEKNDPRRFFTEIQRRLLWNTTDDKKCTVCKKKLTWADFTVDHIRPHSKGGQTVLKNAAIFCRKCNSQKGNRK